MTIIEKQGWHLLREHAVNARVSPAIQAAVPADALAFSGSASLEAAITRRARCIFPRITAKRIIEVGPRLDLRDGGLHRKAISNFSSKFLQGIGRWISSPLPVRAPKPERSYSLSKFIRSMQRASAPTQLELRCRSLPIAPFTAVRPPV